MERPQKPYFDIFDKLGVTYKTNKNRLTIEGSLKSGDYEIDGSVVGEDGSPYFDDDTKTVYP
jgi:3-phosphoshikimate 1-carboxyvinyltransferase